METNDEVKTGSRLWFILEFMMHSQRPASELPEFMAAFDSCKQTKATNAKAQPKKLIESTPLIHEGTKPNKHPRAKMVAAEFEGRIDYYGSIDAASKRIGCTRAQLRYALKNKRLINGISVITVSPEEVFQMKQQYESKSN